MRYTSAKRAIYGEPTRRECPFPLNNESRKWRTFLSGDTVCKRSGKRESRGWWFGIRDFNSMILRVSKG